MGNWYSSGTISVANGSFDVYGTGTSWRNSVNQATIDDALIPYGGALCEIGNVISDTHLQLVKPYSGATITAGAYSIIPMYQGSTAASLAAQLSALLSQWQNTTGNVLGGKFSDGSAPTPAYSFVNEPSTGFYRYGGGAVALSSLGSLSYIFNPTVFRFGAGETRAVLKIGSNGTGYLGYLSCDSAAGLTLYTNVTDSSTQAGSGYTPMLQLAADTGCINFSSSRTSAAANTALAFSFCGQFTPTGNLLLGTTSDTGYRLNINGSAYVYGAVLATGYTPPTIGALGTAQIWGSASSGGVISFVDPYLTADNRIVEWNQNSSGFIGRFVKDDYSEAKNFFIVSGGYALGATGALLAANSITLAGQVRVSNSASAGPEIIRFDTNTSTAAVVVYASDSSSWNGAQSVLYVGKNDSTGRSISTSGTVNASGNDYAEFEAIRTDCGSITAGDIVGFDSAGKVTSSWTNAATFGIVSSEPGVVGGDTWASSVGPRPTAPGTEPVEPIAPIAPIVPAVVPPPSGNYTSLEDSVAASTAYSLYQNELANYTAAQTTYNANQTKYTSDHAAWVTAHAAWLSASSGYSATLATWQNAFDAAAATVERIAYAGKVPVNGSYTSAAAGDLIIAVQAGDGITGQLVAAANHTFAQLRYTVGRIKSFDADGRPRVVVMRN